jgi:hypothetical protein
LNGILPANQILVVRMISKPSALPRDVRSLQRMVIEKEALLSERAQTIAEREAQLAERDRVIAVPRGGRALLAGLICCAHCGRRLSVLYTGRYPRPVYRCEQPNLQLGQRRCLSIAGKRIDESIAAEMLRAVAPMAIEAAEEAERMLRDEDQDTRRVAVSASSEALGQVPGGSGLGINAEDHGSSRRTQSTTPSGELVWLIKAGILNSEQIMPDAPHQPMASFLPFPCPEGRDRCSAARRCRSADTAAARVRNIFCL